MEQCGPATHSGGTPPALRHAGAHPAIANFLAAPGKPLRQAALCQAPLRVCCRSEGSLRSVLHMLECCQAEPTSACAKKVAEPRRQAPTKERLNTKGCLKAGAHSSSTLLVTGR